MKLAEVLEKLQRDAYMSGADEVAVYMYRGIEPDVDRVYYRARITRRDPVTGETCIQEIPILIRNAGRESEDAYLSPVYWEHTC